MRACTKSQHHLLRLFVHIRIHLFAFSWCILLQNARINTYVPGSLHWGVLGFFVRRTVCSLKMCNNRRVTGRMPACSASMEPRGCTSLKLGLQPLLSSVFFNEIVKRRWGAHVHTDNVCVLWFVHFFWVVFPAIWRASYVIFLRDMCFYISVLVDVIPAVPQKGMPLHLFLFGNQQVSSFQSASTSMQRHCVQVHIGEEENSVAPCFVFGRTDCLYVLSLYPASHRSFGRRSAQHMFSFLHTV